MLSGAAMNVALNDEELEQYLKDAKIVSEDYPVVISRYILDAQVCISLNCCEIRSNIICVLCRKLT